MQRTFIRLLDDVSLIGMPLCHSFTCNAILFYFPLHFSSVCCSFSCTNNPVPFLLSCRDNDLRSAVVPLCVLSAQRRPSIRIPLNPSTTIDNCVLLVLYSVCSAPFQCHSLYPAPFSQLPVVIIIGSDKLYHSSGEHDNHDKL
jgi:hypothetical protein